MSVAGSNGSPICRAFIRSANFSMKSSATESTTKNRFAAMQDCPQLTKRPATAPVAATSRSASSATMKGSDPPSSSTTFFTSFEASRATATPVPTDPVRLTTETGLRISAVAVLRSPTTTWKTSSGRPASLNAPSRFSADWGVALAGLTMTELPAIKAGIANRTICHIGKFHGMIDPRTPRGWKAT